MALFWKYKPTQVLEDISNNELRAFNQEIAEYAYYTAVQLSPYRTGAFRHNWHISQGSYIKHRVIDDRKLKPGDLDPNPNEVSGFKARPFAPIHLTNYTRYAEHIEYGSSKIMAYAPLRTTVESLKATYGIR